MAKKNKAQEAFDKLAEEEVAAPAPKAKEEVAAPAPKKIERNLEKEASDYASHPKFEKFKQGDKK